MLKVGDSIELPRDVNVTRQGETLRFEKGTVVYISGHGSVITETGEELFLKTKYLSEGINIEGISGYISKKIFELKDEERTEKKVNEIITLYLKSFGVR